MWRAEPVDHASFHKWRNNKSVFPIKPAFLNSLTPQTHGKHWLHGDLCSSLCLRSLLQPVWTENMEVFAASVLLLFMLLRLLSNKTAWISLSLLTWLPWLLLACRLRKAKSKFVSNSHYSRCNGSVTPAGLHIFTRWGQGSLGCKWSAQDAIGQLLWRGVCMDMSKCLNVMFFLQSVSHHVW